MFGPVLFGKKRELWKKCLKFTIFIVMENENDGKIILEFLNNNTEVRGRVYASQK
jgi:hypothetical protein